VRGAVSAVRIEEGRELQQFRWLSKRSVRAAAAAAAVAASLTAIVVPAVPAGATATTGTGQHTGASVAGSICQLGGSGQASHVVHIAFDNTHFTRDNPNVPSDLEQMPNLLNFIEGNGTLLSDHHTPLIAHTATDLLTEMTGVYGDRHGQPISNSYRYFTPTGTRGASSFAYWTAPVNDTSPGTPTDTTPTMLAADGTNAPAPWVPYTRAGCDFGAVGTANAVLENVKHDIPSVFGDPSPELTQYNNNPDRFKNQEVADYVGIAVHCAQASTVCSGATGVRADTLPAEPGGYAGYQALFGHKYAAPAVSPSGPITDLNGTVITNPYTKTPGFPGFDGMSAAVSLGYAADMLERGIPVTYAYLSDLHDNHSGGGAYGPGQAGYVAALQEYDAAFGTFVDRLAADGIDQSNTLFVFTSDEGDHFVGIQQSDCDGVTTPCTYGPNQVGEVSTNVTGLLATQRGNTTPFGLHSDSAPNFWVNGNPARDATVTRNLERDVAALTATNPYTNVTEPITNYLADSVEAKVLHMSAADPARNPTFTMFARPDYYLYPGAPNCSSPCVKIDPAYAWNHGDVSPDINTTWLGLVGPGVKARGVDSTTWSDHTDVRPTMLSLLGLRDDYRSDGRVLIEDLTAVPPAMADSYPTVATLSWVYKQLNAAVGSFGLDTLKASTKALNSGSATDDTSYADIENQIADLGGQRDQLATQMIEILDSAAFSWTPVDQRHAWQLISQGTALLGQAHVLAES
jgi:hypothetical protein